MKLLNIPFDDLRRRYLIFNTSGLPEQLALASTTTTQEFEVMGSSCFFASQDGSMLAKVVPDKFERRRSPVKWLLRDYLEKRWLGQCDARKEYHSLQIIRRNGLVTPFCHGWGVSLNPGNRYASLLLMQHIRDAQPGGDAFDAMNECQRLAFLERICAEVARLAHAGYVHRDLHYNNLLVRNDGSLVWIDAHVRRLPKNSTDRWLMLKSALTTEKLRGDPYRLLAEDLLQRMFIGR